MAVSDILNLSVESAHKIVLKTLSFTQVDARNNPDSVKGLHAVLTIAHLDVHSYFCWHKAGRPSSFQKMEDWKKENSLLEVDIIQLTGEILLFIA